MVELKGSTIATRRRMSASERRDQILAAAFAEFAAHGYHAAATADIARGAGISQPYIYALFPDKKALFLACHERAMQRLRNLLVEASESTDSASSAFARIERAFGELYTSDPTQLMFQLQAHAAASDPEIRAVVRQLFMEMVDDGVRATAASRALVLQQLARGLFMTVALALELPDEYQLSPEGNIHES
ncbi:MAG TPA: TetR/AcrR family transcriptional regulator [Chloroflexota bacterium]|nr:TetR/AcrR family transcriptional regulator [Chloroflexota bacterium]